jgi:hypothetical protein
MLVHEQGVAAQIEIDRHRHQGHRGEDPRKVGLCGPRQQQRIRPRIELFDRAPLRTKLLQAPKELPPTSRRPKNEDGKNRDHENEAQELAVERQLKEIERELLIEDGICPWLGRSLDAERPYIGHHLLRIHRRANEDDRNHQQHGHHDSSVER